MKSSMCENCIKHKTIYCPNSDKCMAREDKLFYEDKYTILVKNEALEEVLKDLQQKNQQLKDEYKTLEENWNKLKEIINIKLYNTEYLQKLCGCKIDEETHIILDIIKKDMQELERGVSDVED